MGALEDALRDGEADAEKAIKAAQRALGALKRVRDQFRRGNLRDLPKSLASAGESHASLASEVAALGEGWKFDVEAHLQDGYVAELTATAADAGARLFERDGTLYAYPSLIRVLPGELALTIDRRKVRDLRPSHVAATLRKAQQQSPRFRAEAFLQSLFDAYRTLVAATGHPLGDGTPVELRRIHDLLTLLPGADRDYPLADFARDISLLDTGGIDCTRDGRYRMSLPASTGTRSSRALTVIGVNGQQYVYYAVAFTTVEPSP